MRVFVTGATGFVGSAVVKELLGAGHKVLGLARSEANTAALTAAGAEIHLGDLDDLESLRAGAAASDGVIHAGFIHDWANIAKSCETDRVAIETLGAALAGSDRSLLITSGTALLSPGHLATEDIIPVYTPGAFPRVLSEVAAHRMMEEGVKVAVMRLPPSVHGDGDHGFVPILIDNARQKGAAAYVGDGLNHWPAGHRLDVAVLYRLVLEKGLAGRFHAAAEQGVPFKEIAGAIGRGLNLPVVSKTPEEAGEYFGWFAHFAGLDAPASSEATRARTGWTPKQVGLLADLEHGSYFGG
jgi:nucleoside-diphosphate-sugar epimerase